MIEIEMNDYKKSENEREREDIKTKCKFDLK